MKFLFRPRFFRASKKIPSNLPQIAECQAVLKTWAECFTAEDIAHIAPATIPDFEDFHENAIRYHYARTSGIPVHILTRNETAKDCHDLTKWRFLGVSVEMEGHGNPADQYFLLKAFRERAGRRIEIVNFTNRDDPRCPANIIHQMHQEGITNFLGKVTATFKYTNLFYQSESKDTDAHISYELFGYAPAHFEDVENAGIIQPVVDMEYEYRCIFIDGQLVTGAGCIEEFTPYNRLSYGQAFDPQLRQRRHEGTPVVIDRARTDTLVTFARESLAALVKEDPRLNEGTIDVALDKDGKPLIVELNGAPNYGLYACNAKLIVDAHAASIKNPGTNDFRKIPFIARNSANEFHEE